jgi:RimJ/RimL family protein N-acetyltransferase
MPSYHKDEVLATLRRFKETAISSPIALPLVMDRLIVGWLTPVGRHDVERPASVALLARWREAAAEAFPSQFQVTLAGTKRWLVQHLLDVPDRLLFWVKTYSGDAIGHLGLFHFDWDDRTVELDNVVRGVPGVMPGIMHHSIHALVDWTFDALRMEAMFLRVFSDNERAIRLYERCGFRQTMRMPLVRVPQDDSVRWIEAPGDFRQPASRYFVTMRLLATERRETEHPVEAA